MADLIYRGPSQFDGRRIRAAVSYGSTNRKTGDVDTLWILDDRTDPLTAARTGSDASVCGNCPHRTGHGELGDCYVTLFQAPMSVWRSTKGKKPIDMSTYRPKSKTLRFGGYGDPGMLPIGVLHELRKNYTSSVGYTHQWRDVHIPKHSQYLMASVETLEEKRIANALGWRTFRVTYSDDKQHDEVVCPATTHGVTCAECKLCSGTTVKAKDIVILAHGSRSLKHLKEKPISV
jgi:hypothetical protein